jgi:rhodanese-related sulfurtransferase
MSIQEITVDELDAALAAGARLIDVRETDEYLAGHVPGAVHVALGTVPDNISAFQGDGTTYVICKSGARSMRACEFLVDQGIDVDVVNVAGGTMGWKLSGRTVVEGEQPA